MRRGTRAVLMRLPSGVGYRMARGLHLQEVQQPEPRESRRRVRKRRLDGIENRVMVRPPGDVWSDDFRAELRRDRHFEGSLIPRELLVALIIAALFALRMLGS